MNDKDVLWFQITVNDAMSMSIRQAGDYLPQNPVQFILGDSAARSICVLS